MYLNVLIVCSNVFECTFSVFMVYFNIVIICFNVFQCVWKYLNVFIDIVIGISPSYSHCNALVPPILNVNKILIGTARYVMKLYE
jgi:hypothetical protein